MYRAKANFATAIPCRFLGKNGIQSHKNLLHFLTDSFLAKEMHSCRGNIDISKTQRNPIKLFIGASAQKKDLGVVMIMF